LKHTIRVDAQLIFSCVASLFILVAKNPSFLGVVLVLVSVVYVVYFSLVSDQSMINRSFFLAIPFFITS